MDESGACCNLTPAYGYARKGKRAYDASPTSKSVRISTIGVISKDGLVTSFCFEGTLNGAVFTTFLEQFLAPYLHEKTVLVLDNASVHKNKQAQQFLQSKGTQLLFLPPYSPELNPIEFCWAKVKQNMRKKKPRNQEELYQAWFQGLKLIDAKLTQNCIKHSNSYNTNYD